MSLTIGQVWLQFCKLASQISIWLAKETAFTIHYLLICLVRQKCRWKGNCFDRWMKTLKCGWLSPDAGELALLLSLIGLMLRLLIFRSSVFFINFPFTTCWYAYLSSPNIISVSSEIVVRRSNCFFVMLMLQAYNLRSSTNKLRVISLALLIQYE